MRCALAVLCCALALQAHADGALHSLWEVHGKHNTVYLLGSIHVLRPQDYPLAPVILQAYANASGLVMEINLGEIDSVAAQSELLSGALLPGGKTLTEVLGSRRHARAEALAHKVGVDLSMFESFAPWFAAEAISQLQLSQLGFEAQSGVEMYFLDRARTDHKSLAGLETVHDQLALFEGLPMDTQSDYLVSSLEQAHDLPRLLGDMVHAWQHGDTAWFAAQLDAEFGRDSNLSQAVLGARNRKWLPEIEALLNEDKNYLVIVGTGHLVGSHSVIDLLKKDGITALQR